MRRMLVGAATVAIAFGLAGCAGSAGFGGIQKIDTNAHTVTLYTGNTYVFDPSVDLSAWKVGDDVKITYSANAATKKNLATSISRYQ